MARLPSVDSKCCVEPTRAVRYRGGTQSQAKYVSEMETTVIDTFVGTIMSSKAYPFDLRYRQPASDSHAAATIAAGPPYIRNIRKTAASAKLIAKRDLGRARLIR